MFFSKEEAKAEAVEEWITQNPEIAVDEVSGAINDGFTTLVFPWKGGEKSDVEYFSIDEGEVEGLTQLYPYIAINSRSEYVILGDITKHTDWYNWLTFCDSEWEWDTQDNKVWPSYTDLPKDLVHKYAIINLFCVEVSETAEFEDWSSWYGADATQFGFLPYYNYWERYYGLLTKYSYYDRLDLSKKLEISFFLLTTRDCLKFLQH